MIADTVLDVVGGAVKAANAVLSVIPALVWALLLAAVLVWGGWQKHEVAVARDAKAQAEHQRDTAIGEKRQIVAQLEQQKKDAAAQLAALTAERDALQAQANEMRDAQRKKDENDRKIIAEQAARLRALSAAAPGGQLRDPNATGCGCGGGSPEGHAGADERGSEEHVAAAGGLVSAPLSGLLLEQAEGADKWGRLYGLARADAMTCRAAMGATP